MNNEQMKNVADDVFKRYPKTEKVFITSDGQAFFADSDAKNHALNNRTGKELEVGSFLRKEEDAPAKGKTAKEAIADIVVAKTAEDVQTILEAEKAGDNRKSVIEAAEKKIVELQKINE